MGANLERINYLANKSRTVGLTDEEKVEQAALRKEYLKKFKKGFLSTIDNLYVLDENGAEVKLKKKPE
ncbi:hypothetical protein SDC9_189555 [bioreactor metagenome]|uniref:Uncharacterized protein n=1 Tax=bioreactor metagenome TaxID=1076179 RepID=A0A645HUY1_9ZZZZ|nr:DUF896 domain-containing protein [Lachnospiraceae bacterium]